MRPVIVPLPAAISPHGQSSVHDLRQVWRSELDASERGRRPPSSGKNVADLFRLEPIEADLDVLFEPDH